jgi:hypothetical protein
VGLSLTFELALHVDLRFARTETTLLTVLVATRVNKWFAPDVTFAITIRFTGTDALIRIFCAGAVVFTHTAAFAEAIVGTSDVLARIALLCAKALTVPRAADIHVEVAPSFATDVELCGASHIHAQVVAANTAPHVPAKLTPVGVFETQIVASVDAGVAIERHEQYRSCKQGARCVSADPRTMKISHHFPP